MDVSIWILYMDTGHNSRLRNTTCPSQELDPRPLTRQSLRLIFCTFLFMLLFKTTKHYLATYTLFHSIPLPNQPTPKHQTKLKKKTFATQFFTTKHGSKITKPTPCLSAWILTTQPRSNSTRPVTKLTKQKHGCSNLLQPMLNSSTTIAWSQDNKQTDKQNKCSYQNELAVAVFFRY